MQSMKKVFSCCKCEADAFVLRDKDRQFYCNACADANIDDGEVVTTVVISSHALDSCSRAWTPATDAPLSSPCLVTDGERVEKARWMPRKREWVFSHAKLRLVPTHWMPLPYPPNEPVIMRHE